MVHQPGTAPHRTGQFLRRAPERTSFHPQREGTHRHRHRRRPPLISARRLAAAGMRVTLLEQRHHLGGAVGAHEVGGILLDSGAESFATRSPIVSDLVKELGGRPDRHPQLLRLVAVPAAGRPSHPSTGIMGIPGNVNDKSLIPVIGKNGLRRAQVDKFLPVSAGENAKTLGELVRIRMVESARQPRRTRSLRRVLHPPRQARRRCDHPRSARSLPQAPLPRRRSARFPLGSPRRLTGRRYCGRHEPAVRTSRRRPVRLRCSDRHRIRRHRR